MFCISFHQKCHFNSPAAIAYDCLIRISCKKKREKDYAALEKKNGEFGFKVILLAEILLLSKKCLYADFFFFLKEQKVPCLIIYNLFQPLYKWKNVTQ